MPANGYGQVLRRALRWTASYLNTLSTACPDACKRLRASPTTGSAPEGLVLTTLGPLHPMERGARCSRRALYSINQRTTWGASPTALAPQPGTPRVYCRLCAGGPRTHHTRAAAPYGVRRPFYGTSKFKSLSKRTVPLGLVPRPDPPDPVRTSPARSGPSGPPPLGIPYVPQYGRNGLVPHLLCGGSTPPPRHSDIDLLRSYDRSVSTSLQSKLTGRGVGVHW